MKYWLDGRIAGGWQYAFYAIPRFGLFPCCLRG
jgi:hypothetical protein